MAQHPVSPLAPAGLPALPAIPGVRFATGCTGMRYKGRDDLMLAVLPKGVASVTTLFGIMKAGAAYVPIDHTAPAERGRRILTDCDVRALVVHGASLDVVPDDRERPVIVVEPSGELPSAAMTPFETAKISAGTSAPARIVYDTSPKNGRARYGPTRSATGPAIRTPATAQGIQRRAGRRR